MVSRGEMPGRMLSDRIVAATDMSTGETQSQMDPGSTRRKTFLAATGIWGMRFDQVEMGTGCLHAHLW